MFLTYSSQEVADLVLGKDVKKWSWKVVQAKARKGELRGRKVGKQWRFLESDVLEWLSHRNGKRS